MRPLRLILQGYRGYSERTVVKFGPGVSIIYARILDNPKAQSNGGGKSTLIYAIRTAFYGSEPHGGKKDDLTTHGLEEWSLELVMGDDENTMPGDRLIIKRSKRRRQSEKVEFWYKGAHYEYGDVQAELTKALGCSPELFDNAIFISRRMPGTQFVTARPAERAKLLEELVADTRIKMAEARVKASLDIIAEEVRQCQYRQSEIQRQENLIQQDLLRIQEQIADGHKQQAVYQEHRHRRLEGLRQEIIMLQQHVSQRTDIEPLNRELQQAQVEFSQVGEAIAARAHMVGDGSLLNGRQACPTCLQPITEETIRRRAVSAAAIETELKQMRAKSDTLYVQINRVRKTLTDAQVQAGQYAVYNQQMESKDRELQIAEKESAPDFVGGYQKLQDEKYARLQEISVERLQLDRTMLEATTRRERFKFWEEGYGRNGLRNLMLDDIRQQMAWYAARHLYQLSGDTLQLYFPQATKNSAGMAREKFEIIVKKGAVEQELCMFSDGEFWKIVVACLFGLGDALMNGTNSPLRFRLLDDPASELDPSGVRELLQACEQLARQSPIIMTLPYSPDTEIKSTIINVVKRGEVSRLEEVRA